MHDIMVSHIHIFLWIIAVGELGFVYAFASELVEKKKMIVACMFAVSIGLAIDAFVVSLGGIIESVPILFSRLRFICHGVLIPFVLPICGYSLRFKKKSMCLVWIITAVLMILGFVQALHVDLVETVVGANIRFAAGPLTPRWVSIISYGLSFGTIIPMVITGAIAWKKEKNPYLFAGGMLMFFFAALGPVTGNIDLIFAITMMGEVCMLAGYYFFLKGLFGELKA